MARQAKGKGRALDVADFIEIEAQRARRDPKRFEEDESSAVESGEDSAEDEEASEDEEDEGDSDVQSGVGADTNLEGIGAEEDRMAYEDDEDDRQMSGLDESAEEDSAAGQESAPESEDADKSADNGHGRRSKRPSTSQAERISSKRSRGGPSTSSRRRARESDREDESDAVDDESEDEDANAAQGPAEDKARGGRLKQHARNWRPVVEEERELIVARGGLIWQAAKPFLLSMRSDRERARSIDVLKTLMKRINTKLKTTLVPGTREMPRDRQKAIEPYYGASHPMLSALMSWSVESGGILYDEEMERLEEDLAGGRKKGRSSRQGQGERTRRISSNLLKESQEEGHELKGYALDLAILETLLIPEVNDVISLVQSSEQQTLDLRKAKEDLRAARQAYVEVEEASKSIEAKLRDVLDPFADKVKARGMDKALSSTQDLTLRLSAVDALKQQTDHSIRSGGDLSEGNQSSLGRNQEDVTGADGDDDDSSHTTSNV